MSKLLHHNKVTRAYRFVSLVLLIASLMPYTKIALTHSLTTLTGRLLIIWGDDSLGVSFQQFYLLQDQTSTMIRLVFDEQLAQSSQAFQQMNGQKVMIAGEFSVGATSQSIESQSLLVREIQPLVSAPQGSIELLGGGGGGVYGSQPWISILCKFNDIASEPKPLSYFSNQYSSAYPGLDFYWREASYNSINLQGSLAVGWFNLPHPRSYYIYDSDADGDLDMNFEAITQDCVNVADATVYFPAFVGINLMFNYDLNGPAWGGKWYMMRDGIAKIWRMTWEPPWGYSHQTVMAHEMGHGFGFPHAAVFGRPYGQGQGDRWDIMGDGWYDCANATDPVYGCLPQHTVTYHKALAGWIPSNRRYIALPGSEQTLILERLTQPSSNNYLLLQIPIAGSSVHFYTLEARRKISFDMKLPGNGIIIHDVDVTRGEPSQLIDIDNNGDTGDSGAVWNPGETFNDISNHTQVVVNADTGIGYRVTVAMLPGFCDGFSEASLDSRWQWVDPLGDSSYALVGSQVRLFTPDGEHDLYSNLNAPRLVQSVIGDFSLKTKVTLDSNYSYQGAGILIWQDQNNYFRLENAGWPHGMCVWYRLNGVYDGACSSYQSDTAHLWVKRLGNTVEAYSSVDGANWKLERAQYLPLTPRIQVGLNLINQWQDHPIRADFEYIKFDWCGATCDLSKLYLPMIRK